MPEAARVVDPAARRRTAPPGVRFDWFDGADGARLRYALWPVPAGATRTVVLVHGRNEYIEKHFETVADLLDAGFAVASFDWRGQGLSERPLADRLLGHITDFRLHVADLVGFIKRVLPADMPRPVMLLGHSMGGHVSLRTLVEHPGIASRAALSAPMLAARFAPGELLQPVMRAVARGMALLAPETRAPGGRFDEFKFAGNNLTTDPERFADHEFFVRAEPRLALGWPTWGWLAAASRSTSWLLRTETLVRVKVPVLILSSTDERVVMASAHERAARRLPLGRIIRFRGARHELLKERDEVRDKVIAAALAFFREDLKA
ncbi:alpha/beta fold hydrolase [Zavarzinia sp. CC-PAN008]|uniref:alpha/beta fold hydrolase n=1 Tax=Zavarzinia sp. CC-PAN008 TaxID=3243332 RepID=UPI003F74776F